MLLDNRKYLKSRQICSAALLAYMMMCTELKGLKSVRFHQTTVLHQRG